MNRQQWRIACSCALVSLAFGLTAVLAAENTDPNNDGSQYAYAENAGWINAEPLADGGPGLEVGDFRLTGYLWAENAGWINLSCLNDSSCANIEFGVSQDGAGNLSGYAWAENAGWVNFAPATAGVTIDPATGDFSGRAWAENLGWVTFASTGLVTYKITTAWRCDPPPATPAGAPLLTVTQAGSVTELSWTVLTGATAHDVVHGDIGALRTSGGDFGAAIEDCLAQKTSKATLTTDDSPDPGDGFWFLVRGANCGGAGSYDSDGDVQSGSRDSKIVGSGRDCL